MSLKTVIESNSYQSESLPVTQTWKRLFPRTDNGQENKLDHTSNTAETASASLMFPS